MSNKKNIIVTSGGTEEYIDDVRVLTNISTGKLGLKIANTLVNMDSVRVHYVCSRTAVKPSFYIPPNFLVHEVRTAKDALGKISSIMHENEIHSVIHAMAVSDFTFDRKSSVKLKSSDPEAFIDYLRDTITKNPKIISYIKEWNPETILVGFKFEVGIPLEELVSLAQASIEKNGCDLVIANDKEEMIRRDSHVGHFVFSEDMKKKFNLKDMEVDGKDAIKTNLIHFLMEALNLKIG